MSKTYNGFILFIIFLLMYIVFWAIIEPSFWNLENFKGLVNLLNGFAIYILPPIVATLAFNRKINLAALIAITLVIGVTIIQYFLAPNTEAQGLSIFIIPWLLMWDFGAMMFAAVLRFIFDKIKNRKNLNTNQLGS